MFDLFERNFLRSNCLQGRAGSRRPSPKHTFRPANLLAALGLASLLAGCSSTTIDTTPREQAPLIPPKSTIAVAPFENLSASRHAGLAAADLVTSVLYAQGYFKVLDTSLLQDDKDVRLRRLDTAPWERQLGANVAAAAAVGRSLKADCVLAGAVDEFGFVDGFGETAAVGVTLRLVRSATGEVLWAGSISRKVGTVAFTEESAHRLLHKVLRDLLGRMTRDLRYQQEHAPRTQGQ